ncbi:hypothetical protein LEN26_019398 [Aphanomyces euteiches]|nr:hypothetical protein LEN26_019398 [Aphanomyces euteiches]
MSDETRCVWFTLVDRDVPHVRTPPRSVQVSLVCTIKEFKVAVKQQFVGFLDIRELFMDNCSKIDDDDTLSGHLVNNSLIGDHGTTAKTALYVVIPGLQSRQDITENMPAKRLKLDHHWTPPLEDVDFVRAEFDLDALSTVLTKQDPIIQTPRLSAFLNDCGGFPSSYFVRTEETMFWRSISDVILCESPRKAVLVGSPGVGKSCFLMLMGFYCAFCKQKEVIFGWKNNKAWKLRNVSDFKLEYLVDEICHNALFLVDGYTQHEVVLEHAGLLLQFQVLTTSCEYDAKPFEESELIVLPAWRFEDLFDFARLTDWTVDKGSVETKERSLRKRVKEQYYYSGGSLGEFCNTRRELIKSVKRACRIIQSDDPAIHQLCNQEGHRGGDQMDRLWRRYVTDHNNVELYTSDFDWTVSVNKLCRGGHNARRLQVRKNQNSSKVCGLPRQK